MFYVDYRCTLTDAYFTASYLIDSSVLIKRLIYDHLSRITQCQARVERSRRKKRGDEYCVEFPFPSVCFSLFIIFPLPLQCLFSPLSLIHFHLLSVSNLGLIRCAEQQRIINQCTTYTLFPLIAKCTFAICFISP